MGRHGGGQSKIARIFENSFYDEPTRYGRYGQDRVLPAGKNRSADGIDDRVHVPDRAGGPAPDQ